MKLFTLLFTGLILISSCHKSKKDITGLWQLHSMKELKDGTQNWEPYSKNMQGYILYDEKGNMSLHMTIKDYEKTDILFHDLKDSVSIEELKHRSMSYNYMAKYEINTTEKVVTHHRISHSNPEEWNKSVQRSYAISADTLTLTTLDRPTGQIRIKWLKIN